MNSVQVAPWGSGEGGKAWSFEPRAEGGIATITIRHGEAVDALSFVAKTPDGRVQISDQFGGNGGQETKIELDWPNEYLTAISGTYKDFYDVKDAITSLEFTTNLGKKYGPYGKASGTAFALTIKTGAIVGFHGHAVQYLNSIGVFARP